MAGGELVNQARASSPAAHQYVAVNQPGRGGYRVVAVFVRLWIPGMVFWCGMHLFEAADDRHRGLLADDLTRCLEKS